MARSTSKHPTVLERTAMHRSALRRYLQTFSPWYDPAKIEIPEGVDALLARYSAMAANAASPESPALSTVPHG